MTKHWKFSYLPIAVLALGLAACGGGGGGTPPPVTGGTPSVPETAACMTTQACLDEAIDAVTAAQEALDAIRADQDSTQAEITTAEEALSDAEMARDEAQTAHDTYVAAQPPIYDMEALDTALTAPADLAASTTPTVTIDNSATSHVRGGEVTVETTDATPVKAYEKATWPVPAISGWAGSVWENGDGDSIVVYTNIEDNKAAEWNDYYAPSASSTPDGYAAWRGVTEVAADDGVLTLANDVTMATRSLIDFAHGLTAPHQTLPVPEDDTDTMDVMENEFEGMFHGVPGTFACTDSCTIVSDADGNLMTLTGTWTFTPEDAATAMVAAVDMDEDYIDFGYWVQTTEAEGKTTYMANTFARGEDGGYGSVSSVEGSATYKGGAAGLFTQREFASGSTGDLIGAGRFTANVDLTVNFSGGGVPADDHNTAKGAITNFRHNGAPIDAAWRVSLDSTDVSSGSWTIPGGTATFYGPTTDNAQPTGVGGTFNQSFDNGRVIGSFGADKQ